MDEDFINSYTSITVNDDIKRLFDDIVYICSEKELKNPALVNETLSLIDQYRLDIPDIMAKAGNFKNGFECFMLAQSTIKIQVDEIDSAYEYVKKHLESTVGYWSENEVVQALKDWRLERSYKREEEPMHLREDEVALTNKILKHELEKQQKLLEEAAKEAKDKAVQDLKGDSNSVAKKTEIAREIVNKQASAYTIRYILNQLIDLGYEFVLDKILESSKLK